MAVGLSSVWDHVGRMLLFDWAMSGWDMELASACVTKEGMLTRGCTRRLEYVAPLRG